MQCRQGPLNAVFENEHTAAAESLHASMCIVILKPAQPATTTPRRILFPG